MTEAAAEWDAQAETFDDEPDHGLGDPGVRAAWLALLRRHLPERPGLVVDVGCGTGSLATLLAAKGYGDPSVPLPRVAGFDLSARMVERAVDKAQLAGVPSRTFGVADASRPPLADGCVDLVLVRHVLWALPDPAHALTRWARLLRPAGRLLLVEGRWSTGAGIPMADVAAALRRTPDLTDVEVARLDDPSLWGGPIGDERYLATARRRTRAEP